jgi:hypothetical protein
MFPLHPIVTRTTHIIEVRMPFLPLRLALAALAMLLLHLPCTSQGWQPAVRLWGAAMNPWVLQHPSGAVLLPIWPSLNGKDSMRLFDLRTLTTESKPFAEQLPCSSISWVGEATGNGVQEVSCAATDSLPPLIMDVFSTGMRRRTVAAPSGVSPSFKRAFLFADVDGDGISDVTSASNGDRYDVARVAYGDPVEPWNDESVIVYSEMFNGRLEGDVISVGRLSGRMCMLKVVVVQTPAGPRSVYRLMELDAEDLRARRDTVRTHMLRELQPEQGYAYASPVIQFDSIWWIGAPDFNIRTMLRVTVDDIAETRPHESWEMMDRGTSFYEPYFYGQRRTLQMGPAICRGDRAILFSAVSLDSTKTIGSLITAYVQCNDSRILSVRTPWFMSMAVGVYDLTLFKSATLVPDLDGDGLEDVVISYQSEHPQTRKASPLVDLFLTTGRLVSTVAERTETSARVRTLPDRWVMTGLPQQDPQMTPRQVPLYAADGRLVALTACDIVSGAFHIHRPPQTSSGALFCVVGTNVVRLQ